MFLRVFVLQMMALVAGLGGIVVVGYLGIVVVGSLGGIVVVGYSGIVFVG